MFATNYTFRDPPRRVSQPTREEAIHRAEQILRAAGVKADIVPLLHPRPHPNQIPLIHAPQP
ncbi:hypothetical protein AB0C42_15690 [Micromonospora taraxaci]|uniref:hypothetical protein n=1 Tax=Micromonospora taraxaci TaxID=1316803 RepID=UPI00340732E5